MTNIVRSKKHQKYITRNSAENVFSGMLNTSVHMTAKTVSLTAFGISVLLAIIYCQHDVPWSRVNPLLRDTGVHAHEHPNLNYSQWSTVFHNTLACKIDTPLTIPSLNSYFSEPYFRRKVAHALRERALKYLPMDDSAPTAFRSFEKISCVIAYIQVSEMLSTLIAQYNNAPSLEDSDVITRKLKDVYLIGEIVRSLYESTLSPGSIISSKYQVAEYVSHAHHHSILMPGYYLLINDEKKHLISLMTGISHIHNILSCDNITAENDILSTQLTDINSEIFKYKQMLPQVSKSHHAGMFSEIEKRVQKANTLVHEFARNICLSSKESTICEKQLISLSVSGGLHTMIGVLYEEAIALESDFAPLRVMYLAHLAFCMKWCGDEEVKNSIQREIVAPRQQLHISSEIYRWLLVLRDVCLDGKTITRVALNNNNIPANVTPYLTSLWRKLLQTNALDGWPIIPHTYYDIM